MICRKISLLATINLLAVANTVAAFLINSTIFGTDISHVTYEPANEMCTRQTGGSFIWQTQTGTQNCEAEAASWILERYRTQQRFATFHRSLDHHTVSLTINFEGVAVWLYAPPRTKFLHPIPDYKVCVHDDDKFWSTSSCYHVDVTAALLDTVDDSVPAVFFAQGGLWPGKHRIVVSMAKPKNDTQAHNGILFSHAVYSVIRPTPWPVKEDSWRFREATMHATHPALSYSPSVNFRACSNKKHKTGPLYYRAESGKMESWRSLGLCGGLTYSGLAANFTASAVAIYGAPWTQLVAPVHIGNTCVRINSGPCEVIDAFHAYLSSNHDHEPVVLWRHDALNPSRETELSIQLMPTKNRNAIFPFKEIRYLEGREYASPHQSVGRPEEVRVAHDDPAIVYHPASRCVRDIGRVCTKWLDSGPWVWKEAGPSGSVLTYRSTLASYRTTDNPHIKLEFRGSEVRIYGAPKSLVKLPLAPQQICLNNICRLVDTEQAYLNALWENTASFSETQPELNPVLLWSIGGLDDQILHTLRLALAPPRSADDAEMTIAKIVYTKVTYEPEQLRPETPAPGADSAYAGPSHPPHSSDWTELPNDPPPPPCPPVPSCPPAPPCPPVPLCPSAAPYPSASLCPSVPPSLLPSPTPTPMLGPPHSSDLTAPPHNPPLPTPPSDPPVNFIVNRILPALIIAIGLHIIGPRIYRAVYPRHVEKRILAHSSERNAT